MEEIVSGNLEQQMWLSGMGVRLNAATDEDDFDEQRRLLEKVYDRFGSAGLYLMARVLARRCAELSGGQREMDQLRAENAEGLFAGMRVHRVADGSVVTDPDGLSGANAALVLAGRFMIAHLNDDAETLWALFVSDRGELYTTLLSGLIHLATLYRNGWPKMARLDEGEIP